MIELDGVIASTIIRYYGYRQARAWNVVMSGTQEDFPGLREALHADLMGHAPNETRTMANHETFVLKHGDERDNRCLAITFTDNRVFFGLSVQVGDW